MLSPLAAWIRADWARHGLRPVGGGLATPSHPVLAEQGTAPAPWAGTLPGPATQGRLSRARPPPRGRGPCHALPPQCGASLEPINKVLNQVRCSCHEIGVGVTSPVHGTDLGLDLQGCHMAPLTHHLVDPGSVSTGSRDTAPVSVFSTLPVDVYPPPPRLLLHEPLCTISVSPWGYCMLSPLAAWIRADWARHGLRPVGGGLATPSHPVLAEQGTAPAPWAGTLPGPATQGRLSRARPPPRGRGPCHALPPQCGASLEPINKVLNQVRCSCHEIGVGVTSPVHGTDLGLDLQGCHMAPLTHHLVDPGSVSTGSRDTAPVSVFSTLPVDVYPPPPRLLLHEPLCTISVSPWGYCMLSPLAAWIRADWARHGLRPVGGGLATPSHPVLAEQGTAPAPWAGTLPGPATQGRLSRARPPPRGRGPCHALPPQCGASLEPINKVLNQVRCSCHETLTFCKKIFVPLWQCKLASTFAKNFLQNSFCHNGTKILSHWFWSTLVQVMVC